MKGVTKAARRKNPAAAMTTDANFLRLSITLDDLGNISFEPITRRGTV